MLKSQSITVAESELAGSAGNGGPRVFKLVKRDEFAATATDYGRGAAWHHSINEGLLANPSKLVLRF